MFSIGDFTTSETVIFKFNTFDSSGGSVTITGLAITDVEIYSGISMTQRASDNGIVLLDTDGIDLDGSTGIHGFSIDLSDNSDAGFYVAGNQYTVTIDAITIDSQTVRFVFSFTIGRFLRPTTAGRTLDVASTGEAGVDLGNVTGTLGNASVSWVDGSDKIALLAATQTSIDAIEADTNELQGDWVDAGRLDAIQDLIAADVVNIDGASMRGTDSANTTTPPTVGAIADQVWDEAQADHVAAGSFGEIATEVASVLVDTIEIGVAGAGLTDLGGMSTTMKGQVNTEADTALTDYDGPTDAEMNARTLVAASYFDAATDTVANVTTVGSVTTKTGYDLSATGLDLVLIDGKTLPVATQIIAASVIGIISGAGTGTEVFKGLDKTTTRATVTVDGTGNRSAITYV